MNDLNDIEQLIKEDVESKQDAQRTVWYLINGMLSVMDYHDTKNEEDFKKAKIFLEHGLTYLKK